MSNISGVKTENISSIDEYSDCADFKSNGVCESVFNLIAFKYCVGVGFLSRLLSKYPKCGADHKLLTEPLYNELLLINSFVKMLLELTHS